MIPVFINLNNCISTHILTDNYGRFFFFVKQ